MPKDVVVSFRLSAEQFTKLTERMNEDKPIGIKSAKQQARKLVVDALEGRTEYKNNEDRFSDLELLAS
jgi:hypothetical protein